MKSITSIPLPLLDICISNPTYANHCPLLFSASQQAFHQKRKSAYRDKDRAVLLALSTFQFSFWLVQIQSRIFWLMICRQKCGQQFFTLHSKLAENGGGGIIYITQRIHKYVNKQLTSAAISSFNRGDIVGSERYSIMEAEPIVLTFPYCQTGMYCTQLKQSIIR